MKAVKKGPREDVWVPTICGMCMSTCHIRARRVDGVVVQIEGNPDSPLIQGKNCAKSQAAIMTLYDPSRVKYPLKRTNPRKGKDEDPGWTRISWDEALDTITERIREALAYDPKSVYLAWLLGSRLAVSYMPLLTALFGRPGHTSWGGTQCGHSVHLLHAVQHSNGWAMPDWEHIRYYLAFGTQLGDGHGMWVNVTMATQLAEARARGMKMVVVDPFLSPLAEKADEWIPIRPGTDGMFALAMLNLLLNEWGVYDRPYLRDKTNAPYLIRPDGYYLTGTGDKPQVWDQADGTVKLWDDPTLTDPAIEGSYTVQGTPCRPAFQVLKEHVGAYTVENASRITTVPAETIVRLAREYVEAASIGSTITVQGQTLPYRPAVVWYSKGAQGHKHSYQTALSLELLNNVVGNAEAPGGLCSAGVSFGHPETHQISWRPIPRPDGLLAPGPNVKGVGEYPPRQAAWPPVSGNGIEMWPLAISAASVWAMVLQPELFDLPEPRVLLTGGTNPAMNDVDPDVALEALGKIPFIASIALYLDETAQMADIVLPDKHFLESLEPPGTLYDISWYWNQPHMTEWTVPIRQPVVEATHEERQAFEVLLELAQRLGKGSDLLHLLNFAHRVDALDIEKSYTAEQIIDELYKAKLGPERGLDYMKRRGVETWPKAVQERYWAAFSNLRVPIYMEWFPRVGEQLAGVLRQANLPAHLTPDLSDYTALPDWRPCPAYEETRPEFDLYLIYYKHALMSSSSGLTYNNGWLNEVGELLDPYLYYVTINAETARRKGIADGDWVWLESASTSHKVKARARLSVCIHPEVAASANNGGHWAKGLPIASQAGKGIHWETMLPYDLQKKRCGVSANADLCERVKVYKA